MRSINCPHPPRKYYKNGNNNNQTFDILAIVALGISIYIANLGRQNLEYNKKNSETSKIISSELKKLNQSTLINDIRCHLKKEEVTKNDINSL